MPDIFDTIEAPRRDIFDELPEGDIFDQIDTRPPARASLNQGFDASLPFPEFINPTDLGADTSIGGLGETEAQQMVNGRLEPILRALPVAPRQRFALDTQGVDPDQTRAEYEANLRDEGWEAAVAPADVYGATRPPVDPELLRGVESKIALLEEELSRPPVAVQLESPEQMDVEEARRGMTALRLRKLKGDREAILKGADLSLGHQAMNTLRSVAGGAGVSAAEAGAGILKVGGDIAGLAGIRDPVNEAMVDYLRRRATQIPTEQGVDPLLADTMAAQFGQGLGSMVPTVASGPFAPATIAGMMGEAGRRDAELHGATPEQQNAAFYLNAAVGGGSEALLGVPQKVPLAAKLIKRFAPAARAKGVPPSTLNRLARAAVSGYAREGTQEGTEQLAGNLIANSIVGYDPTRGTFEGVPESAFIGGLVGAPVAVAVETGEPQRATTRAPGPRMVEAPVPFTPTEPVLTEAPVDIEISPGVFRTTDPSTIPPDALMRREVKVRGQPTIYEYRPRRLNTRTVEEQREIPADSEPLPQPDSILQDRPDDFEERPEFQSRIASSPQPKIDPELEHLNRIMEQRRAAQEARYQPPVEPEPEVEQETGTVRLYHGAAGEAGQAGRDFTPDRQYAEGYAAKSGAGGMIWYVDVPADSPFLRRDEEGNLLNRIIVPDEIADSAQPEVKPEPSPEATEEELRQLEQEYRRDLEEEAAIPFARQPVEPGDERVASAAVKMSDGNVFSGYDHGEGISGSGRGKSKIRKKP